MNLFRNKCVYCNEKIEKGKEIFQKVSVPSRIGKLNKPFCSEIHAVNYEKEAKEYMKNSKKCGGCC